MNLAILRCLWDACERISPFFGFFQPINQIFLYSIFDIFWFSEGIELSESPGIDLAILANATKSPNQAQEAKKPQNQPKQPNQSQNVSESIQLNLSNISEQDGHQSTAKASSKASRHLLNTTGFTERRPPKLAKKPKKQVSGGNPDPLPPKKPKNRLWMKKNLMLYSKKDMQILRYLITASLQSPKINSIEDSLESLVPSSIIFVTNSDHFLDTFSVYLNTKIEAGSLHFELECIKNEPIVPGMASREPDMEIDYAGLAKFGEKKMNKLLADIEPIGFISAIDGLFSLRRYEKVINCVFLRGLDLKIDEKSKKLKLGFNRITPGLVTLKGVEMLNGSYEVRLVHNCHHVFRVLIISAENPKSKETENRQKT